ncbi:MAG: phage tail protein [Saprospiraceae bacterium]|nr:phage tail protein [Saprospiraceae bacterium]
MAEPYLSEIRIMSFNFPPKGWAMCNGQLLPINQNQALFSLLGTTYGGNGQTNFALPNLRGRAPIHMGNGHNLGEAAGSTSTTINIQQLPQHSHFVNASSSVQNSIAPGNNFFAATTPSEVYSGTSSGTLLPQSVTNIGGSQPHNNMQPYLILNFCIALQGIFPSQN